MKRSVSTSLHKDGYGKNNLTVDLNSIKVKITFKYICKKYGEKCWNELFN